MRCRILILLLVLAATSIRAEEPVFRVIRGTVLNIDGTAAMDREVRLIGLSRTFSRSYSETNDTIVWNFKTDQQGRFLARMGCYGVDEARPNLPGWGVYAFVVCPTDDDAGAVSSILIHSEKPKEFLTRRGREEWGDLQPTVAGELSLTLQIKEGVSLKGTIRDYAYPERPLEGIEVVTFNDLYSDSHTGRGGEIFFRSAVTDAEGNFEIEHVFPARFYVNLESSNWSQNDSTDEGYWLKTNVNGTWLEDALDVVNLREDGTVPPLEILAARKPLFHYKGKIQDEAGVPVAQATITFGISYHAQPHTHADYHSYRRAETKSDGTYAIDLPTPWVRGMSVENPAFQRVDHWEENNEAPSFQPGLYDFVMKPKTP